MGLFGKKRSSPGAFPTSCSWVAGSFVGRHQGNRDIATCKAPVLQLSCNSPRFPKQTAPSKALQQFYLSPTNPHSLLSSLTPLCRAAFRQRHTGTTAEWWGCDRLCEALCSDITELKAVPLPGSILAHTGMVLLWQVGANCICAVTCPAQVWHSCPLLQEVNGKESIEGLGVGSRHALSAEKEKKEDPQLSHPNLPRVLLISQKDFHSDADTSDSSTTAFPSGIC